MMYKSNETERNAAMHVAELMAAAARTAPKACGVDNIVTLILDGEEKKALTAAMREFGEALDAAFIVRDADNVDACPCVILIGCTVNPRGLHCGLCGMDNCKAADEQGVSCAMTVHDLGIAVGSAASVAMDHRIDNRVLFSAGMASLKMGIFPDEIRMCFGIGLSVSGKNIFFDRPAP